MADKDVRRNYLASSASGIPARPAASRLQPPMIRTQRSTSSLAPTPSSSSGTKAIPSAATSPSSRIQPTAGPNQSVPPRRSPALASKSSSTTLRSQRSNGFLGPSTSKLTTPTSPVSRVPRAPPPAPRPPVPPRTPNTRGVTSRSPKSSELNQEDGVPSKGSPLPIREQIAARRAALKKELSSSVSGTSASSTSTATGDRSSAFSNATRNGSGFSDWGLVAGPEDVPFANEANDDAPDDLGRPTIRQAVIKALSTGSLNVTSRQLTSLPTSLFTLHLGVTPAPLSNGSSHTKNPGDEVPSGISRWEAVDLTVLKAGDNEIVELQGELGLFGGLKSLDLHKNNHLATLPATFADLACLTHLDLSHCLFASLPSVLSTLPALIQLNMSHNALISLSFGFSPTTSGKHLPSSSPRRDEFFYPPASFRVGKPFPALQVLIVGNNKISAQTIRPLECLPRTLVKLDLNNNPLCGTRIASCSSDSSGIAPLFETLAGLKSLKELLMRSSGLSDTALGHVTLDGASFPKLEALDAGDNDDLSEACVRRTLLASRYGTDGEDVVVVGSHMDVLVAGSAAAGAGSWGAVGSRRTLKLVIGRHVVKEAWEIELERRASPRKDAVSQANSGTTGHGATGELSSEANDAEDNRKLFSLGEKETPVRRNAAGPGRKLAVNPTSSHSQDEDHSVAHSCNAGGHDNEQKSYIDPSLPVSDSRSAAGPGPHNRSVSSVGGGVKPRFPLDKYYDDKTRTLVLPPALPQTTRRGGAAAHARSMSLKPYSGPSAPGADMLLPLQTLPHALIVTHLWARTSLRALVLSNRRVDISFLFAKRDDSVPPLNSDSFLKLPVVEELRLDGCNLTSRVKVSTTPLVSQVTGSSPAPYGSGDVGTRVHGSTHFLEEFGQSAEMKEMELLPTLHCVFPALTTLDLSYNALTTLKGVGDMFLGSSSETPSEGTCANLQTLRVRGNKIDVGGLDELVRIGEKIKLDEAGAVSRWHGVEVDLRENEIAKLPSSLGWLPLDIMLVEGNIFRVPNRRLWERDGTKGLLSFLRATMD